MTEQKYTGTMAKDRLEEIKFLMKTGEISYEEAQKLAKEPLEAMNAGLERISKEFGERHRPITFLRFMR